MSGERVKQGYLEKFAKVLIGESWQKVFAELYADGTFVWYKKKNDRSTKGSVPLKLPAKPSETAAPAGQNAYSPAVVMPSAAQQCSAPPAGGPPHSALPPLGFENLSISGGQPPPYAPPPQRGAAPYPSQSGFPLPYPPRTAGPSAYPPPGQAPGTYPLPPQGASAYCPPAQYPQTCAPPAQYPPGGQQYGAVRQQGGAYPRQPYPQQPQYGAVGSYPAVHQGAVGAGYPPVQHGYQQPYTVPHHPPGHTTVVYQQRTQPQTVIVHDRRSHGMGNMASGMLAGYAAGRMMGGGPWGYGYGGGWGGGWGWGHGSWGSCSWGSNSWGSFSGGSWGSFGGFD